MLLFELKTAAKSLGHLLKVSVTCTNKQIPALLLSPVFFVWFLISLHSVYGWHCNAFSRHFQYVC